MMMAMRMMMISGCRIKWSTTSSSSPGRQFIVAANGRGLHVDVASQTSSVQYSRVECSRDWEVSGGWWGGGMNSPPWQKDNLLWSGRVSYSSNNLEGFCAEQCNTTPPQCLLCVANLFDIASKCGWMRNCGVPRRRLLVSQSGSITTLINTVGNINLLYYSWSKTKETLCTRCTYLPREIK